MKRARSRRLSHEEPLGRLARLPLALVPAGARVRVLWGPLRGARWIAGSGVHRAWLGFYEPRKARLFASELREGAVVFDIGAHVGFYTLLAARAVGPRGVVVAFEPNPANLVKLERHVALNDLTNVTIVEAAVDADDGHARFHQAADGHLGRLSSEGSISVETVSIDRYVERSQQHPRIIKIDIEGGELGALRGATSTLTHARPIVFLATHGAEVHERCCNLLRSFGYQLRALDAERLESATEVLAVHPGQTSANGT